MGTREADGVESPVRKSAYWLVVRQLRLPFTNRLSRCLRAELVPGFSTDDFSGLSEVRPTS